MRYFFGAVALVNLAYIVVWVLAGLPWVYPLAGFTLGVCLYATLENR